MVAGRLVAHPLRAVESCYRISKFTFAVRSVSSEAAAAVDFVYREFRDPSVETPTLRVEVVPVGDRPPGAGTPSFDVSFDGSLKFHAEGLGSLLHQLDNELTVVLETAVPERYYIHAAALADEAGVTILVGDSGAGKSTTAYALLCSGMEYLSDEIAAVNPATGEVHAYPRALCLKREPPAPLILPPTTLRTEWTLHVSPRDVCPRVASAPIPLNRIVFVRYSPDHGSAQLRTLSKGEAALRLYRGALNQLAHPSYGLDDTLNLIRRSSVHELLAAGIEDTLKALGRRLNAG